ncbi:MULTISPECIES: ABC transporter permease [Streptomycetaceae]|uniref:ABC transporter permease n=1 Tax=Streptomycetaceae TaxID=2062 RepID=UPI00093BF2E2|nr:ABC transporter permease [Streptomyces sp. CB02056]OKH98786.1 macrolide ABC transporter permease [Streptomyces sp. CB02056]
MLIVANVRERWSSHLACWLAVLVGVGLITATLTVHESARPAVQPRLSAATALVLPPQATGRGGSAEDRVPWNAAEAGALTDRLRAAPGVAAAVVDRAFYAQAVRDGRPVPDEGAAEAGHGWSSARLAPYRLLTGRGPEAADEVVVDRSLGVPAGARLTVNLTAGRTEFTVVGTVDGPGYYLSDAAAAQRDPGVRTIALLPAPGTPPARLAAAARTAVGDRAAVVTGEGRAALQPRHVEHRRFLGTQVIAALATLGLFTTGFVVASMLVLATGLRRRELGLLRVLGATPGQLRRMVLGEAALVGLLGSAAGCLAGLAAAPLLRDALLRLDVAPPGLTVRVTAWPLLTAAATGVGVSVLGAWAASRPAARVAPLQALRESRTGEGQLGRTRLICGVVVLGLGTGCAVLTATAAADRRISLAITATMLLIAAAALLAPVLVGPVGRVVTAPLRRLGTAGPLLLRAGLTAGASRAAAAAAPVIAAVGFAVLLSGAVETMRAAYPAGQALRLSGQAIVTNDGTPGLTDEAADAHPVGKAALPTRAFVHRADGTTVVIDALGSRDPAWSRPGEAVLGTSMARWLGVTAGQRYPVRFADGATVPLLIAGILPDDPARGDFVLARSLVRGHDPAALGDDLFVPAEADPVAVVPGTAVHDAVRYALDDYDTDARLTDSLAAMLIAVAVGYSAIATANSTALSAHGRRRDLAVLRSTGGTVRQLVLLAAGEAAVVTAIGTLLGLLATLPPLAGLASGLAQSTGAPVTLHLDPAALASVVLACLLLSGTTAGLVTWRVLRRA